MRPVYSARASLSIFTILIFVVISIGSHSNPIRAESDPDPGNGSSRGPVIDPPEIATYKSGTATITGTGFGTPGPGNYIIYTIAGGRVVTVPSDHPAVLLWEPDEIRIDLPPRAPSGKIRVITGEGSSGPARLRIFQYTSIRIPDTPGTNASPLAVTVDQEGRLWVNEEFHLRTHYVAPGSSFVDLLIPQADGPGIFASTIFSDHRTHTSILGEDIITDTSGDIWLSQGGGYLYEGVHPNHSRVLRYDLDRPDPEDRCDCYNVPTDWAEVMGVMWDEGHHRIWFTMGGLIEGNAVVSFDPDRILPDCYFDFSVSIDSLICPEDGPYEDCFRYYSIPTPATQPAHMALDANGNVWITEYWGKAIAVLDPETGDIEEYPVPPTISEAWPSIYVGSGPWQMMVDEDGTVWFTEFFDNTISRFFPERRLIFDCTELDSLDRNPCIEEYVIPGADMLREQVHSLAMDDEGNIWWGQHQDKDNPGNATVGYFNTKLGVHIKLPPLREVAQNTDPAVAGIVWDPFEGAIRFSEFWEKEIGQLREVLSIY